MRQKLPRKKCLHCLKECSRPEKIYCNNRCQKDFEWIVRKTEIELTGEFKATDNGRVPKRYLLEKYGNVCLICVHDEWEGKPIPLVLNHIDGNSDNWKLENLQLICPNCDTFTPFYKGRNKGNGRFKRKQRFKEGKSF